jgi:hypothetical protein
MLGSRDDSERFRSQSPNEIPTMAELDKEIRRDIRDQALKKEL